jgi:hypothetical protein
MPGTLTVVTALSGRQVEGTAELGEEGAMSTEAGSILDPTDLAKRDVAHSRDIVASAAQDLKQHQQWLESYIVLEKRSRDRHIRSLKREQARQRRRLKRQRVVRSGKRAALGLAISVRSISRSLLNRTISTFAYLRTVTLATASWIASTTYALAVSLLRLLLIGSSRVWVSGRGLILASFRAASISFAWIGARTRALALASLRAALVSAFWVASGTRVLATASRRAISVGLFWARAEGRALALASLKAASVGASLVAVRTRALAIDLGKAITSGVSWTRTKGHALALASLNATSASTSWVATRTRDLAIASGKATSSGLSWTQADGHAFALASRDAASVAFAWTAARTGTLARATSEAASIGLSKGHALALASQDAALIGCTWIAAKSRACAQASLSAASTGSSWMRASLGDLALKLSYAGSMASPWIRTTAHGAMSRLLTLGAAARVTARHQSERAALLALKLNVQVKAEIDALRRGARAGKLTPAAWRKLAAIASTRKAVGGFAMEEGSTESKAAGTESERGDATFRNGHHTSRNALICVEPWRSRLPVVQTGAREIRFWQFRSKATDRRHVSS